MDWDLDKSKFIYGIGRGDLFFLDISEDGKLVIIIENQRIDIDEIITRVKSEFTNLGVNPDMSFTLRLPQLINNQINKLVNSFQNKIEKYGYSGTFQPLYPIKVNQRKVAIQAVVSSHPKYGLEAGTKAEMYLILKQLKDEKHRIIACNGVKDQEYITMIGQALQDDYNILVSIESMDELFLCLDIINIDKVKLVLRLKPYVKINGYWGDTSGRNSKFGLSIDDLLNILQYLENNNLQDLLVGIHSHPGSQIDDLESINSFVSHLVNLFIEIRKRGYPNLNVLNFGGGLPINYDSNVTEMVELYTDKIVKEMSTIDNKNSVFMIEAGRAITAHSAMAIIQILEVHNLFPTADKALSQGLQGEITNSINSRTDIFEMWENYDNNNIGQKSLENIYSIERNLGTLKPLLRKKYFEIGEFEINGSNSKIHEIFTPNHFILGNFSIFNSACDHVMVNQYFPVLMSNKLAQQPETLVRLVDITCDSDGEISIFHTKKSDELLLTKDNFPLTSNSLLKLKGFPVGDLNFHDSYAVIPLIGAYQDVIEFDHNLIGDLPDIKIEFDANHNWSVKVLSHAQSIEDLLSEVGYTLPIHKSSYIK